MTQTQNFGNTRFWKSIKEVQLFFGFMLSPFITCLFIYLIALLSMAFYTLLERKILGYIQERKGPNKVSIRGIPQPLADALKLFVKEQTIPSLANMSTFFISPVLSLFLALFLWALYPFSHPHIFITIRVLVFLCISSLNVYTTLGAGWSSNSKYALLGALRRVAQTISYEVSIVLILLRPLIIISSLNLGQIVNENIVPLILVFPLLFFCWFTTTLAETNRTPFDFAEGESELVSGFNIEYRSGTFALIFMAEYTNIIIISLLTTVFFFQLPLNTFFIDQAQASITIFIAIIFLWIRGTLPRIRYDRLINLTWKSFLIIAITILLINSPLVTLFVWYYAGKERIALMRLNTENYLLIPRKKAL